MSWERSRNGFVQGVKEEGGRRRRGGGRGVGGAQESDAHLWPKRGSGSFECVVVDLEDVLGIRKG